MSKMLKILTIAAISFGAVSLAIVNHSQAQPGNGPTSFIPR